MAWSHRLGLLLALAPHISQHAPQLGLLLVHLVQTTLGLLLLGLQLLQATRLPVQVFLQLLGERVW